MNDSHRPDTGTLIECTGLLLGNDGMFDVLESAEQAEAAGTIAPMVYARVLTPCAQAVAREVRRFG